MSFRALVLTQGADRKVSGSVETLPDDRLPAGDVTVAVSHSTLNYKDVLVLTSGEKISPSAVEAAVLRDAAFEQVMVVGDGRPYPVLLAVSGVEDERELLRRANARLVALPRWTKLRQVVRVGEPWGVDNGLLTPTQKLKRPRLVERYRAEIDAAYRRGPGD